MLSINDIEDKYEALSDKWNSKNEIIDEKRRKKYKRIGLKKWQEKVDQAYAEMASTGINDFSKIPEWPAYACKLIDKNEVEHAVAELEIEELENECSKMWKKMESILNVNSSNTTFKKISQQEKRRLERETCAICYEEHNISQIITIGSCGHSFGKKCFTNIISHSYDHFQDIKCPCCRNQNIDMIRYRK
jgi:hypothetical protein